MNEELLERHPSPDAIYCFTYKAVGRKMFTVDLENIPPQIISHLWSCGARGRREREWESGGERRLKANAVDGT